MATTTVDYTWKINAARQTVRFYATPEGHEWNVMDQVTELAFSTVANYRYDRTLTNGRADKESLDYDLTVLACRDQMLEDGLIDDVFPVTITLESQVQDGRTFYRPVANLPGVFGMWCTSIRQCCLEAQAIKAMLDARWWGKVPVINKVGKVAGGVRS